MNEAELRIVMYCAWPKKQQRKIECVSLKISIFVHHVTASLSSNLIFWWANTIKLLHVFFFSFHFTVSCELVILKNDIVQLSYFNSKYTWIDRYVFVCYFVDVFTFAYSRFGTKLFNNNDDDDKNSTIHKWISVSVFVCANTKLYCTREISRFHFVTQISFFFFFSKKSAIHRHVCLCVRFQCVNDVYDFILPVVEVLTINTHLIH